METNQQDELHPEEHGEDQAASKEQHHDHRKGGIHNNALFAASMGRSATSQVDPHTDRGLGQTGTNISYEGATSPGGGGSVGSGYTSGQSGVDTSITSDSDFDRVNLNTSGDSEDTKQKAEDAEDELNEQR